MLWFLKVFISPSTVRNILKRGRPKYHYIPKPRKPLDSSSHDKKITGKYTNHIWSIDLYSLMIGCYQCSIMAVIDQFSRKLIHANFFFGEPGAEWITNNLRYAVSEYNCPKYIIFDNGGQFRSSRWKCFLYNYNIKPRKGKPGIPYSNGKIECFFLSLKTEVLNFFPLLTEKRTRKLLQDYQLYYNQYRPHQALGGAIPDKVYNAN